MPLRDMVDLWMKARFTLMVEFVPETSTFRIVSETYKHDPVSPVPLLRLG